MFVIQFPFLFFFSKGMHEVLAPFVALSDPELPTSDISLCYSAFIKRFLPYAFNQDEEFLSLQVLFGFVYPTARRTMLQGWLFLTAGLASWLRSDL